MEGLLCSHDNPRFTHSFSKDLQRALMSQVSRRNWGRSRLVSQELVLEFEFQLGDRSADFSSWALPPCYIKRLPPSVFSCSALNCFQRVIHSLLFILTSQGSYKQVGLKKNGLPKIPELIIKLSSQPGMNFLSLPQHPSPHLQHTPPPPSVYQNLTHLLRFH